MNKIKEFSLLLFLLFIIIVITFFNVFDGSKFFVSGDSLSPISFRNGINNFVQMTSEYPLWSPWIFSGMPTVHSFLNISDSYYPHKIFLFFHYLGLPWVWNFLLHLIFGGLGMYSLLRHLCFSKYSSFFSASFYMIMPYMIAMTAYGHGSQIMTAAYIPWIILYLFKVYEKIDLLDLTIFSLLIGFQLQRGHIQIAYYTWMMIGLFIVIKNIDYLLSKTKNNIIIIKNNIYVFASLLIGFVLSLNIYAPVLKYAEYSTRSVSSGGAGFDYATQWSMSLKEYITMFIPSFLGFGGGLYWGDMPFTDYPNYFGIILFIFSIFGICKTTFKREYKIFFLLVIGFSFCLSLGSNFPSFYKIFYNYLPFFNKFRVPAYILILFFFSMLVFTAQGIEYFIDLLKSNKSIKKFIIIVLNTLISLCVLFFTYPVIINLFDTTSIQNFNSLYILIDYDLINIMCFMLIFLITLLFYLKYSFNYRIFYIILFGLCLYDYVRIAHEVINPSFHLPHKRVMQSKDYMEKYLAKDELVKYLQNDKTKFRIFDAIGPQNKWSGFNIENINGYHSAKLNNYNKLINTIYKKGYFIWPEGVLKLLNVKYIVLPFDNFNNKNFENVISSPMYYFGSDQKYNGKLIQSNIYKYKKQYPRLFYTKQLVYLKDDDLYDKITDESFDPKEISYTNQYNDFDFKYDNSSYVDLISWTPNKIEFLTKNVSNQFLVFSEIFYPNGWKLTDGKKDYDIINVNGVLRGALIPKGTNKFSMYFNPIDLKYGNMVSLLVFFIMLIIMGLTFKKKYVKK